MINKFANLFKRFFDSEKVAGLLLLLFTVMSLIVANSSLGDAYLNLIHHKLSLPLPITSLDFSVEEWVNDGLMTIFFLMVGLEVKRELYIGELADMKKAILPVAAAIGGMLVPSLIHFVINNGTAGEPGFAIPMATDIAFALGILALAGDKIPTSVKVFLAALAIIDDIGAVIVIALFYTKQIFFTYLLTALTIFCLLLLLKRLKVRKLIFYLLPAVAMWYCFLKSGVHPTLSGILLAFAIPFDKDERKNLSSKVQLFLHKPVAFVIVPVFALVNTAIVLPDDFFGSLARPNSIGIIAGLFIGKVAGIVSLPLILIKTGIARLQEGVNLKLLTGIGFLGGIGFTMSMFISNLAFDDAFMVITSKLSILTGSALSAVTGFTILKKATG